MYDFCRQFLNNLSGLVEEVKPNLQLKYISADEAGFFGSHRNYVKYIILFVLDHLLERPTIPFTEGSKAKLEKTMQAVIDICQVYANVVNEDAQLVNATSIAEQTNETVVRQVSGMSSHLQL